MLTELFCREFHSSAHQGNEPMAGEKRSVNVQRLFSHYLIGIYGRFFFGLACVSVIRSFLMLDRHSLVLRSQLTDHWEETAAGRY